MTRDDWCVHISSTTCHVCAKPLEGDSVRDHCHITGKYRGAAHNACNLKLRLNPKTITIPVVFHNLRGYDSHLLMQAISKVEGHISCIPNNMEKYITFSLGQLRFIDSAQFLPTSLDKLVSSTIGLPGPCKKCKATLKGEITQDWLFEGVCKKCEKLFSTKVNTEPLKATRGYDYNPHLLGRKVYPYEYMDSWERSDEHQRPPKETFYSKLSDEHISDEDYAHAQKIWEVFDCKTLRDYCDLYCCTDVLLIYAIIFACFSLYFSSELTTTRTFRLYSLFLVALVLLLAWGSDANSSSTLGIRI